MTDTETTTEAEAAPRAALIAWTPAFETGIEKIDDQHRHLVDLINNFDAAAQGGRGRRVMGELLDDLLGYTQEHFADEEKYLESVGYEKLDYHRALHRQLVQKLELVQFEFKSGERKVTKDMRDLLAYWVTSHILRDDLEYAAATRKSGDEVAAPDPVS